MARSRKRTGGLFAVVLVIILILLILQVYKKGPLVDDTFIIKCNNKEITSQNTIKIELGKLYAFSVKDETAVDGQSFSVHLAVHQADKTLIVDGREVMLVSLQDLTSEFVSEITTDGFVFCQHETLSQLLSAKFDGKTVIPPSGHIFDLVITSADGNYVVKIPLYFSNNVDGIELDNVHIVF